MLKMYFLSSDQTPKLRMRVECTSEAGNKLWSRDPE